MCRLKSFTGRQKQLPKANTSIGVDTAKYRTMPPTVKKLFTNSAGLAISFTTNSPRHKSQMDGSDNYQLPNLTRVAQKGLDLYIKRDGNGNLPE